MKAEIYGASWCAYCKSAVSLCENKGIEFDYIDVDVEENLKDLESKIGRVKSVPQIFLDGKFLPGGFTGLKQELAKD